MVIPQRLRNRSKTLLEEQLVPSRRDTGVPSLCFLIHLMLLASHDDMPSEGNNPGRRQLQPSVRRGSSSGLHVGCGSCSMTQNTKSVSACWIPNRLSLDATYPRWYVV